jgi:hypothetical protein
MYEIITIFFNLKIVLNYSVVVFKNGESFVSEIFCCFLYRQIVFSSMLEIAAEGASVNGPELKKHGAT